MTRLLPLIALLVGTARADVLAHETFTLKNGLRVFLLPDHRAPTVAVVTWYRVGSADEEPGRTGFAHLFEHLMFKGSPHIPEGVIDKLHEDAGGWVNAFTSHDMTVYTDFATSSLLERMLWLEADRMGGLPAAIDQAKLDNQRDVVLNERRETYENAPYGMAPILINEALWPLGFPYRHPVIGDPADIKAATLADVKAFFARHYQPANATMVIAGDFDPAAARGLVDKYFSWMPSPNPPPRRPPAPPPPPLTGQIDLTATDAVQVPRVYLTWRGVPAYHADEASLDLAAAVLAGGKSSRLYRVMVMEKRLAQSVVVAHEGLRDVGQFQIVATLKPGIKPADAIAALDAEVQRLRADGPAAAEVDRAQNGHEMRFFSGLEDLMSRALQLATYAEMARDPNYLDKDLARYRAVTAEGLRAALARVITPGRVVLVIGPGAAGAR